MTPTGTDFRVAQPDAKTAQRAASTNSPDNHPWCSSILHSAAATKVSQLYPDHPVRAVRAAPAPDALPLASLFVVQQIHRSARESQWEFATSLALPVCN